MPHVLQGTATTAPVAPRVLDDANIRELQARLANLQTRVAVLEAQRGVLVQGTRSDNSFTRGDAEGKLLSVDLDLAGARAQLASVETQLGQAGAPTTVINVPPTQPSGPAPIIDPDAVTAVFVLTAIAILIPLSIGITRRLWRRPVVPSASMLEDKLSPRLDRLEQAVDAIAIEVERISEAQRFVAKVLSERPPVTTSQASNDAAGLSEGKPFLALGAGPMEPIRMAERQAVKQSVTPH
jgi:hypothetical protein